MSIDNVATEYLQNPAAAPIEGTQAHTGLALVASYTAETIIPYGRAVIRGTGDRQAKIVAGSSGKFLGVSLFASGETNPYSPPPASAMEKSQYEITEQAMIMTNGTVWVWTEEAVSPGDVVYYRHTAGTAPDTTVGRFRKTDDTGKTTLLSGAQFVTTAAANTLAQMTFSI